MSDICMTALILNKAKLRYPVVAQPKIDGLRCIFSGTHFFSRDGKIWQSDVLQHLQNLIQEKPLRFALDGEIYIPGLSLQDINAAFAVKRVQVAPPQPKARYYVFDAISQTNPFFKRVGLRDQLIEQVDPAERFIVPVPNILIENETKLEETHQRFLREGYEGTMVRDLDATYQFKRTKALLKYKPFLDAEATVVDTILGEGKISGLVGALVCIADNGARFNCGTGMDDQIRSELLTQPIPFRIKYKYQTLTNDGVPRHPVFYAIL